MGELTRTFVCPQCGYAGFKMSEIRTTLPDVNVQFGCPICKTARGLTVWLEETSDPRSVPANEETAG